MNYRGEIALITAGILYGFFGVFTKLIGFSIPMFYQAWVRCLGALIMLAPIAFFLKGHWRKIAPKDHVWFFLRSFCGFISFLTIYIAFIKLDIGTAYFLTYASSMIVGYILGIVLFQEKLTKSGILAFTLSFIALSLIYSVHIQGDTLLYVILAIISGAFSPGWNVFSKKISSSYSILQLNVVDTAYAFVFPFITSLLLREPWTPISWTPAWIYSCLLGCLFMSTGFLIVYGFKKVSAQTGMILMLIEIVAGIIFGYLFFTEMPSFGSFVGGGLIILAMLIRTFAKDHHEI